MLNTSILDLSIIIVNYNTSDLTRIAVDSCMKAIENINTDLPESIVPTMIFIHWAKMELRAKTM